MWQPEGLNECPLSPRLDGEQFISEFQRRNRLPRAVPVLTTEGKMIVPLLTDDGPAASASYELGDLSGSLATSDFPSGIFAVRSFSG